MNGWCWGPVSEAPLGFAASKCAWFYLPYQCNMYDMYVCVMRWPRCPGVSREGMTPQSTCMRSTSAGHLPPITMGHPATHI